MPSPTAVKSQYDFEQNVHGPTAVAGVDLGLMFEVGGVHVLLEVVLGPKLVGGVHAAGKLATREAQPRVVRASNQ